jgi:four helix bundle protein
MFDFEKLICYGKAKEFHKAVKKNLKQLDANENYIKDQLLRASLSIALNIAEGSGRFSKADKKHFYIMARASVYECAAIIDIFSSKLGSEIKTNYYSQLEVLSKMLLGLINSQK